MKRSSGDVMMSFKVRTETVIAEQRIADVLVGAFEGGSNYWVEAADIVIPGEGNGATSSQVEDWGRRVAASLYGVVIVHADNECYQLDRAAILRGLEAMALKYPKDLNDIVNENDDAETSDKLLQLSLFGELVYG